METMRSQRWRERGNSEISNRKLQLPYPNGTKRRDRTSLQKPEQTLELVPWKKFSCCQRSHPKQNEGESHLPSPTYCPPVFCSVGLLINPLFRLSHRSLGNVVPSDKVITSAFLLGLQTVFGGHNAAFDPPQRLFCPV